MTVKQLARLLEANGGSPLRIMLPSGEFVPDHFHVTEVGRVRKTFVDCGGTRCDAASCLLQAWVAHDVEHRLSAAKLSKILKLADGVLGTVYGPDDLPSDDLPLEVEYGDDVASHYTVAGVEVMPDGLLFVLAGKRTACLAPDKCGVGRKGGCC